MTKLCASFVPSARWICIFLYSRFRRVAIAIAVVILLPSSSHRRRHPIAVVIPSPSSSHRRRHFIAVAIATHDGCSPHRTRVTKTSHVLLFDKAIEAVWKRLAHTRDASTPPLARCTTTRGDKVGFCGDWRNDSRHVETCLGRYSKTRGKARLSWQATWIRK
ncbi:hypothetical protein M3J07_013908 [Ascochyta lentis]